MKENILYRSHCGVLIKKKYTGLCRSKLFSRYCLMKGNCMMANTCPMAKDDLWNVCSLSSLFDLVSLLYYNLLAFILT